MSPFKSKRLTWVCHGEVQLIYADQNIIICASCKKREPSELIDGSQWSTDLILPLIWKLPRFYRALHPLYLYFCWQARLFLPEHLFSLTRRLIVHEGEGWFMVHKETSGRSAFHNLLGPIISHNSTSAMVTLQCFTAGVSSIRSVQSVNRSCSLCSLHVFSSFSYF